MSMTMAARAYDDPPVTEPRMRRSRATQASRRLPPIAWFRQKLRRRPVTTLAYCAFAAAGLYLVVNAVAFQTASIPRAFLGDNSPRSVQAPPAPPVRPAELAAQPQPAAVAQRTQTQAAPSVASQPTPPTAQRPQPVREPSAPRDPLGDLIRTGQVTNGDPVPAMRPPAPIVQTASLSTDNRPVMAAQRALNRAGFGPITADGRFGEQTRAAIERFERDRKIPVTRDLSPRTLRELTTVTGMRME